MFVEKLRLFIAFFTQKILIFGRYVFIIVLFVTLIARFLLHAHLWACNFHIALNFVSGCATDIH